MFTIYQDLMGSPFKLHRWYCGTVPNKDDNAPIAKTSKYHFDIPSIGKALDLAGCLGKTLSYCKVCNPQIE